MPGEPLERVPSPEVADDESRECGVGNALRIGDGCEVDPPDAVGMCLPDVGGDLGGEFWTFHTPHADQRDHARPGLQALKVGQLPPTSDKAGGLDRKVVGQRTEGARWREPRGEMWVRDLEDALGPAQIPQSMDAEREQGDVPRQAITEHLRSRVRHQDLGAVRQGTKTGAPDDDRPHVVAFVSQLRLAGVEGHANADGGAAWPELPGEDELGVDSRGRKDVVTVGDRR